MAPPKGPRMPACEPCRRSKLSCDHARPACTRCVVAEKADVCVYRRRPFSRKRQRQEDSDSSDVLMQHSVRAEPPSPITTAEALVPSPASSSVPPPRTNYPNPGYMGASSHVAIFSQISQQDTIFEDSTSGPDEGDLSVPSAAAAAAALDPSLLGFDAEMHATKVAECMRHLLRTFSSDALRDLVSFWRATRVNLALAEPLLDPCRQVLEDLKSLSLGTSASGEDQVMAYARRLLRNSIRPLNIQAPLPLGSFCAQFVGENSRLETIGLLFCAVIRAASEVHVFPALYLGNARRQELVSLAVRLTNVIVEAILSLDMLNDLQLVLQYENFISHSFVFGVQSYHSFRKLGDVITSIMSLGYHETLGSTAEVPCFIIDIRRTALCRAYSADKNWAIFLGRPPRLAKKYCNLHVALRERSSPDESVDALALHGHGDILRWRAESEMTIWAETRWTAACASLKEEILEIFRDSDRIQFDDKVNNLQMRADQQWDALPKSFRMRGSLKDYDRGSWERDFLASTRLNYLHVHFLLELLRLGSSTSPAASFVNLSREIVALVAEVIVLRNELVCSSGTSFEWKLAHYGLPAIGIILIAMLRRQNPPNSLHDTDIIRDLGIVIAGVELGTIVRPTEPNYALLSSATRTIKKVLVGVQGRDNRATTPLPRDEHATCSPTQFETWVPQAQLEPWDFEFRFWENLAEHPYIFDPAYAAANK